MSETVQTIEPIQIEVSRDGSEAILSLQPTKEVPELLKGHLQGRLAKLGIRGVDEEMLDKAVHQATGKDALPVRTVIARGTPPMEPVDGRIEWTSGFFDPLNIVDDTEITHYERAQRLRRQRMVEEGQMLCRIADPVEGAPGRDVYDKPIDIRQPKSASVTPGERVAVSDDGKTFTATAEGELRLTGDRLSVVDVLEVEGDLNFRTGNIDFPGTVIIHGDVLDNFVVHGKANVQVDGSVGAAEVVAVGDLNIGGGVNGRGRSLTKADGDLTARFLDYTFGKVEGDLLVENGIYLSTLRVRGKVEIRGGGIRGGKLYALGAVEVSSVGSSARTATLITTSPAAFLEKYWEKPGKALADVEGVIRELGEQLTAFMKREDGDEVILPEEREDAAELARQMKELQAEAQKLLDLRKQFEEEFLSIEPAEIEVCEILHAGTQLALPAGVVTIEEDIAGPVLLRINDSLSLVSVEAGGKLRKLRAVAEEEPEEPEAPQ